MEVDILPANYIDPEVPDYQGNPLIEALPPIYTKYDVMKLLTVDPKYDESERELGAHHCRESCYYKNSVASA